MFLVFLISDILDQNLKQSDIFNLPPLTYRLTQPLLLNYRLHISTGNEIEMVKSTHCISMIATKVVNNKKHIQSNTAVIKQEEHV